MQVTAERGTKTRVRNKAKWKLVKERPSRLQSAPRDPQDGDSDSDDDWSSGLISHHSHQEEVQADHEDEEGIDGGDEEAQQPEPAPSHSPIATRTRNKLASVQLSPRERKRRRVKAIKRDKQDMRSGGNIT